jgi:RNA recognition motif-containing protein
MVALGKKKTNKPGTIIQPFRGGAPSKGNGKGAWVWMPAAAAAAPAPWQRGKVFQPMAMTRMAPAKPTQADKIREKLRSIDASKKVWVGNLSKKTTWKELEKHFKDVAKPTVVDINEKKGTGVVCFKTEEDATSAIGSLNGSELGGEIIEVDVWTKIERTEEEEEKRKERKKEGKKKKKPVQQMVLKQKPGKKAPSKVAEKLKEVDHSLKVWVGGLSPNTTWQKLSKHFETVEKPKIVDIMGKGKAVVAYEDIAHVDEAISVLNDTELDGKTIQVDTWNKPEKKEKKIKEEV